MDQHSMKVTTVGNSLGVILPKEVLAKLKVGKGDKLFITETPDGITVRAYDEKFAHAMELAEKIMREDRDVLKRLAE